MKKELRGYISVFIIGVLLIIVYKTFDNFSLILGHIGNVVDVFMPIIGGAVIAYILYPMCKRLEKFFAGRSNKTVRRMRRGLSVAAVYLGFILFLALILVAIIPMLTKSITELIYNLPAMLASVKAWLNSLDLGGLNLGEKLNEFSFDNIINFIKNIDIDKYASGIMGVGNSVFRIFMSFIISVYILLDRSSLKKMFGRISKLYSKGPKTGTVLKYLRKVSEFIYKYIYCLLIDAIIIFILSLIVLSILRVPYAFVFAFLIGICNMIPYFGAIIATVLTAVFTVFTVSFGRGLTVAIALIALQQVDANIIQPRLYSGSFNIRPLWVIVGILVGGGLFGILGILLAVPIMAVLATIADDVLTAREEKKRRQAEEQSINIDL